MKSTLKPTPNLRTPLTGPVLRLASFRVFKERHGMEYSLSPHVTGPPCRAVGALSKELKRALTGLATPSLVAVMRGRAGGTAPGALLEPLTRELGPASATAVSVVLRWRNRKKAEAARPLSVALSAPASASAASP
eukprot:1193982-Prorocentrum_minimum.AAC.1